MLAITICAEIRSNDDGDLVLPPIRADRGIDLLDALQAFDPALGEQLDAMRCKEHMLMQDRETL